ncbi:TIGR01666 family membrane protein [Mucilaginibacter lappiensis]|uniref:Membrane protein (TIGR01666 family) n=1 Tax=Mucilaginibacter lappiensis TaxID=354630 RepID=A0ABR6PGC2_9SPHI|nr:FUSC family membrane protein [Mucilaginibacter lappiensis]MBB6108813.1 putative membrane protein (TIGR01666 family) [Mucilaginibacter lappiensis]SIQ63288.1 TIGR01666 family membrane protein [Mucilaginibacter lappiensis]
MNINTREIKSFFYSQYFSDGLRITAGILLPSLILLEFNQFDLGLTFSLGALCICVIDNPGPVTHKRNSMAIGNLCLFLVAAITGFARLNLYTLGLEITLFSFLFSMFTVYGNRAASVGTCSLLIMIFMMDKAQPAGNVLWYSATILLGGLWYMAFSLIFFGIRPYRAAQQALGENVADIAKFLRIKADFYLPEKDIDDNYRKLVSQQIQVSQHQDAVRELLFKSRVLVRESTGASRILVLTFVDLVDMFEQIMATHYDYSEIRERFKDTGILNEIARILQHMADEVDEIAYMVLSNVRNRHLTDFNIELEKLKLKIDDIGKNNQEISNLVLKKILINLRDLSESINNIYNYYHSKAAVKSTELRGDVEYSQFVTHQDYAPHIFFDNFTLDSGAFKHALRVSLVCLVGFITAKTVAQGHHSYWVLLTIIVILKPGFSLSKQRNYQRLIGTICGGVIGILILSFIPDTTAQFVFLMVFMIGTYSFSRLNYVVSVIFMTPYVLILFKFLGVGLLNVAQERILDTVIGSSIAFIASYLIFPTWEFDQIQETLRDVIVANINYLITIAESLSGKITGTTLYKLARKDVYVKSANLSAAFERMTSEPKSKQRKVKEVHKFVVLNHILSSYIANIASGLVKKESQLPHAEALKLVKKSISVLNESNKKLLGQPIEFNIGKTTTVSDTEKVELSAEDALLKEQLGFINKISYDIAKITDNILQ